MPRGKASKRKRDDDDDDDDNDDDGGGYDEATVRRQDDDHGVPSDGDESGDERDGGNGSDDSDDEIESFFVACAEGALEEAKRMLKAGAGDVNAVDPEEGDTPLHVACRCGHLEVAQWLVGEGASIAAANAAGETPLHDACFQGGVALIEWLLDQPVHSTTAATNLIDRRTTNEAEMAPIGLAALHGHTGAVKSLAAKGADVSVVDAAGNTLVHMACSNGHVE